MACCSCFAEGMVLTSLKDVVQFECSFLAVAKLLLGNVLYWVELISPTPSLKMQNLVNQRF